MPRFVQITPEQGVIPYTLYPGISGGPLMIMQSNLIPLIHEQVPEGELAVHQGARIEAQDGPIGHIDEFLLDPTTMQIDYLVFRRRSLWHREELIVPASHIEEIKNDTIYLTSDKHTIEQMQNAAIDFPG